MNTSLNSKHLDVKPVIYRSEAIRTSYTWFGKGIFQQKHIFKWQEFNFSTYAL